MTYFVVKPKKNLTVDNSIIKLLEFLMKFEL